MMNEVQSINLNKYFPELINYSFSNNFANIFNILDHFGKNKKDILEFISILKLVEELREYGCLHIPDKFSDTPSFSKLLSLKSEFLFATEFAKIGFNISLISDSDKNWRHRKNSLPSPDFLAINGDKKVLVEVAKISDDETIQNILTRIRPFLTDTSLYVWIVFSKELSLPVMNSQDRDIREQIINNFIEKFREILTTINQDSIPQKIDILNCQVEFHKLDMQRGNCDGMPTAVIIPQENLDKHIKNIIHIKAEKRTQWSNSHKQIPYLVALDIQQDAIFHMFFLQMLFGDKCHYEHSLDLSEYSESTLIHQAKCRGWKDLLEQVGYRPRFHDRTKENGLYFEDQVVRQNITGIIARICGQIQFIPNPFAEDSINCPELQQLLPWSLCPSDGEIVDC
jgi:hypothetical protein